MNEAEFKEALKGKKIPILVLDQKWHRLFAVYGKNEDVKEYEQELHELLAKQGRVNTEIKELKSLKATLMQNIMRNMEGSSDSNADALSVKKQEENTRLIGEVNEKLALLEDEALDIPNLIKEKNNELMLATMEYCYETLRMNQTSITEISEWIKLIRVELKKNIIRKQNCEINNKEMYAYMHDTFGAQVIDIFDIAYEEEEETAEEKNE